MNKIELFNYFRLICIREDSIHLNIGITTGLSMLADTHPQWKEPSNCYSRIKIPIRNLKDRIWQAGLYISSTINSPFYAQLCDSIKGMNTDTCYSGIRKRIELNGNNIRMINWIKDQVIKGK